jgi:hypothetical protein
MVEDLPERYVPAADETLAWDQLPDYEPLTHLKPNMPLSPVRP